MDVEIEAGGKIHRVVEDAAVLLAENLRAFPKYEEDSVAAADRIEDALVGRTSQPLVFSGTERVAMLEAVDMLGSGPFASPEMVDLFWALHGGPRPSSG